MLAFSHDSGVTVAEVAFLLLLIAGIWIAFGWLVEYRVDSRFRGPRFRMTVAGVLIAVAGVLLIVAAYWGHLFSQGAH